VDLTLYDLSSGAALAMPCAIYCFDFKAHSAYAGAAADVDPTATANYGDAAAAASTIAIDGDLALRLRNRDQLRSLMEGEVAGDGDFSVQHNEWWHFDYRAWRDYTVLDVSFEDLDVDMEVAVTLPHIAAA